MNFYGIVELRLEFSYKYIFTITNYSISVMSWEIKSVTTEKTLIVSSIIGF